MSILAGGLKFHDTEKVSTFDSAAGDAAAKLSGDSLEVKAVDSEIQGLRKHALHAVLQLADDLAEDDLDEDESPTDRFDAYVTAGDDGEEVDDMTAQIISANMADAFANFGVDEDMITSMLSDDVAEADAAIEAACEMVVENAPTTDDELINLVNEFVFGEEEAEAEFDAVVGKSTVKRNAMGQNVKYRGVKVIRNGKVKIVNKRVNTGMKIRLSAKQKAGMKKMRRKAFTGSALRKRMRSAAKSRRIGLS